MVALSASLTKAFGVASDIADAGNDGASPSAQAAAPISKKRFMTCLLGPILCGGEGSIPNGESSVDESYRVRLCDDAMRGAITERVTDRIGRKPSVEISGWPIARPRKSCRNSKVVSAFRLPTRQPMIAFCVRPPTCLLPNIQQVVR